MNRRVVSLLLAASVCLLCGCGSLFDKEYVVVSDYVPVADDTGSGDRVTVRDLSGLKAELLRAVTAGEQESKVQFDAAYNGDVSKDMAKACWQVRTQDALCAYCVQNIAYELSLIVSHYEAVISISYSPAALSPENIVKMQYATELEETMQQALESGQNRLAILLGRSDYDAEDMEALVSRVYQADPISAPKEPQVSVNMFSGTGRQRLYEIRLRYNLSAAEFEARRQALSELAPFEEEDWAGLDGVGRALLGSTWLAEHCVYEPDGANDIYSALVLGRADSEGMALGFVELCRRLELPCQIVYGQRNWESHCWNIVEIDGVYYHIDAAVIASAGLRNGFMLNDETAWMDYRWDVSAYPVCTGEPYNYEVPEQGEKIENTT